MKQIRDLTNFATFLATCPLIAGGAPEDEHFKHLPEEIVSQLTDLGELDDKALKALEAKLVKDIQAAREGTLDDEVITIMTEMSEAVTAVRAEAEARIAADTELQNKADELLKNVLPAADAEETDESEGDEGDDSTDETDESEEETPDNVTNIENADEVKVDNKEEVEEPAAVAASAKPKSTPGAAARHIPKSRRPQPKKNAGLSIVAAGDVPGYSAGLPIPSLRHVGLAFRDKARAMSGAKGRALVASVHTEWPEERQLGMDAEKNEALIAAVASPKAIAAAGGICQPVNTDYGFDPVGTTARPVRDALARFNADRGGVRRIPPLTLSQAGGAIGVWDNTIDGDPGVQTKPCLVIDCGEEETIFVEAITRCVEAGNFLRKFSPERFDEFWQLTGVAQARTAEDEIWDAIVALSTAVTAGQLLGTSRDVLTALDRATAAIRSHHRMADDAPMRWMAPFWVKNQIRADVARQLPGDNKLAVADAEIETFFNVRSINPTWSLDATQVLATEAGAALQGWPSTFESLLFPEGTFVHLDGGQLDFGMEIRDSVKNATNQVQAFAETFEGVYKRGVESYVILHDTCPSGEVSGTLDVTGNLCTTGS